MVYYWLTEYFKYKACWRDNYSQRATICHYKCFPDFMLISLVLSFQFSFTSASFFLFNVLLRQIPALDHFSPLAQHEILLSSDYKDLFLKAASKHSFLVAAEDIHPHVRRSRHKVHCQRVLQHLKIIFYICKFRFSIKFHSI